MIKTIVLDGGIEKRIRGKYHDDVSYDLGKVSAISAGHGVLAARLLHPTFENEMHVLCAHQDATFIKQDCEVWQLPYHLWENKQASNEVLCFIDEMENAQRIEKKEPIQKGVLSLMSAGLSFNSKDCVILHYPYDDIEVNEMQSLLSKMKQTSGIQIASLHPTYWDILNESKMNVLVVTPQQYHNYCGSDLPLSEIMEDIKVSLTKKADMIIYVLHYNDFLIFADNEVYRCTCSIKNANKQCYIDAFLAGVVESILQDGDIKMLSECCLGYSSALALSDALVLPSNEALLLVKEKMMLYSL